MPSWPAKDPEAVADYRYDVALDEGDALASITLIKLSGSAALVSTNDDETGITAWLSGGADGETNVFRVAWTTTGGRTFDDIITLPIAANEIEALALTGYAKPSAAHLIARHPAFAAVSVATIRMWLADAERFVDRSWPEGDYAAALMVKAAYSMARQGLGASSGAGAIPAGVTRFKSASMEVQISDKVAAATADGGVAANLYAAEFAQMQRRNFGGPRVVAAAPSLDCCGSGW